MSNAQAIIRNIPAPTGAACKSIHPEKRMPGVAARRSKNHARNKQVRADLNRAWQGDKGWNQPGAYHSALFGLSNGSAG